MADLKISDLPTDIVTLADGDKFAVADASALTANTYCTAIEIKSYVNDGISVIRIDSGAGYTLTSNTLLQAAFPAPNALTVDVGAYIFEALLLVTAMSATSGNLAFSYKGAGTAALTNTLLGCVGIDGPGTVANQTGSWVQSSISANNILTSGTSTLAWMRLSGSFNVSVAGTLIPSVQLNTASTAVVERGSYCRYIKVASGSVVTNVGNWS